MFEAKSKARPMHFEREVVSINEAVEMAPWSLNKVRRLVDSKVLPSKKVGRTIYIPIAAVRELLGLNTDREAA